MNPTRRGLLAAALLGTAGLAFAGVAFFFIAAASATSTALFAVLTMFTDFGAFDLGLFWEHWQGWAQFGNWVLAVTVSLTVGAALRAGEPPESQYP